MSRFVRFTTFDHMVDTWGRSPAHSLRARFETADLTRSGDQPPPKVRGDIELRPTHPGRFRVRWQLTVEGEFDADISHRFDAPRIGEGQQSDYWGYQVREVPDDCPPGSVQFIEWLLGIPLTAPPPPVT